MKIKLDYITNSSSTAMIVCLPKDINKVKEELHNFMDRKKNKKIDGYDYTIDKRILSDAIDSLVSGELVHSNVDCKTYGVIRDFCYEKEYMIIVEETNCEDGFVRNVTDKEFEKIKTLKS